METALQQAIDRHELRLHYQPIVLLATGQITGFEALLRWSHPDRGLLSAAEFIGLAEKQELMLPLTRWTLKEACRQLRVWHAQLPTNLAPSVSVNVNAQYLAKQTALEEITDILSGSGLNPHNLALEVSEDQITEHAESISKTLISLSDVGIKLCIDGFGTGHSSLRCLARCDCRGRRNGRTAGLCTNCRMSICAGILFFPGYRQRNHRPVACEMVLVGRGEKGGVVAPLRL